MRQFLQTNKLFLFSIFKAYAYARLLASDVCNVLKIYHQNNTLHQRNYSRKISPSVRFARFLHILQEQEELAKSFVDPNKCEFGYSRHLGLIPLAISDLYPASHYVETYDADPTFTYLEFAKTWEKFFLNNSFDVVYYSDDKFLTHYIRRLPKGVRKRRL